MSELDDIARTAKEAAYTLVGFAVLGWQKAQVRRQEVSRRLGYPRAAVDSQLSEARVELGKLAKGLDAHFRPVAEQIDQGLERLEAALPGPAAGLVHQARHQAGEARSALLDLVS